MSEVNTKIITEENKLENGKINMMGVNIDISTILGGKIVDQYLAQLSDEDMQKIINYISADLFEQGSCYNTSVSKMVQELKVKEPKKDYYGHIKDNEVPIGYIIRNYFNERVKEELKKKVEEIINTTDYQEKINTIANQLVDYSINGYAEDMKNRIRERLVGNSLSPLPDYGDTNLIQIINHCIDTRIGTRNGGY